MRGKSLLLLAAALSSGPAAAASDAVPETRVEEWTRLRRDKAALPAPPRPGFFERNLLALEKAEQPSLLAVNVGGAYPRVLNLSSGSATAAGIRWWRPDVGRSQIDLHASAFYSIRGYEYYDFQVGRLAHRGNAFPARSTRGDDVYELGDVARVDTGRAVFYGSARYRHYPRTGFYGLGLDSRRDGRASFLSQDALYEVVTGYQGPRGAATVRAGLMQAFIGPGTEEGVPSLRGLYDDRSAPGLERQPDFLHVVASVLLDGRDRPRNPHRGGMIAVAASRFDERGGDEFTFDRIAGDARGFASLGSPSRVLAVRALASADRPASGARVPFYLQEPLGETKNHGQMTRGAFLLATPLIYTEHCHRGEEISLIESSVTFSSMRECGIRRL